MENDPSDVMSLIQSLQDQQAVLQEAVMQLLEQTVKPHAAEALRFEHAMRQRLEAIFQGQTLPTAQSDKELTLLLAALLASAGRPPMI